jgi:ABC-type methionine transport system ATPase subunit
MTTIATQYSNSSFQLFPAILSPSEQAEVHVKVQIPPHYHQLPVLSRLIHKTGVEVNILGGLLASNGKESGWFDLQLQGKRPQLEAALNFLNTLEIRIWDCFVGPQEDASGSDF